MKRLSSKMAIWIALGALAGNCAAAEKVADWAPSVSLAQLKSSAKGMMVAAQPVAEENKAAGDLRHHPARTQKELNDALILEVQRGNTDDVLRLLDLGAEVYAKDESGTTVLMIAAKGNDVDMMGVLLSRGAFINSKDNGGGTALHYAIWYGKVDAAKFLVDQKGKYGIKLDAQNSYGTTPLMAAVDKQEILEYLVTHGAGLEIKNSGGATALMLAAKNGQVEATSFLLRYNADIKAKDGAGNTVFLYAASSRIQKEIELLLTYFPAVIRDTNNYGNGVLYFVRDDTGLMNSMIERGANKDEVWQNSVEIPVIQSMKDLTPAIYAAGKANKEVLRLLIQKGANLNYRSSASGLTVLSVARKIAQYHLARYGQNDSDYKNYTEIAGILAAAGARE